MRLGGERDRFLTNLQTSEEEALQCRAGASCLAG